MRFNQSHVVRSIQSATNQTKPNQTKPNHTTPNQQRISLDGQTTHLKLDSSPTAEQQAKKSPGPNGDGAFCYLMIITSQCLIELKVATLLCQQGLVAAVLDDFTLLNEANGIHRFQFD